MAASVAALCIGLSGCTGSAEPERTNAAGPSGQSAPRSPAESADTTQPGVVIESNVGANAHDVAVDTRLSLRATEGSIEKVTVVGAGERTVPLPGRIADGGDRWHATDLLEPGSTYTVDIVAVTADGTRTERRRAFHTAKLPLDRQTYPSIAPLDGETVGVGMPVEITFDVPVSDRAAVERHLEVTASEPVTGAWHWYSDTKVHFRPKRHWEPGTEVTVSADLNGVSAGNGIYGQLDREISFDIGTSVVSKIYIKRHKMDVFVGGELARTIPVTTGKKGFETRGGTKVIMEKHRTKRMDAATTGISPDDPEYYNIADVPYALRVTYSGEFLHGAPWSVDSQGDANVSHGCVGMSIADARWLFRHSTRGDIVQVFGSDRKLEPGNGWTDWNVSFAEYKQASALS
ncbi:MAG TPA: Ig-like domain-containing protein [Nocardioidaceae bacterium]|nr:Ig-like domain-containing protein [Nocardioidaceae bacterium]